MPIEPLFSKVTGFQVRVRPNDTGGFVHVSSIPRYDNGLPAATEWDEAYVYPPNWLERLFKMTYRQKVIRAIRNVARNAHKRLQRLQAMEEWNA